MSDSRRVYLTGQEIAYIMDWAATAISRRHGEQEARRRRKLPPSAVGGMEAACAERLIDKLLMQVGDRHKVRSRVEVDQ